MNGATPAPATTRSALQALGHDLDSCRVFAELGLTHCKVCGKIWKGAHSENAFESLTLQWLGVVTPSGWTFANEEGELTFRLDIVQELSVAESLLRCAEPCTGRPRDNHPGLLENSIYRLKALDLVDWRTRRLHELEVIYRAVASWEILPWAPRIAVSTLRAQCVNTELIPAASEGRCPR